MILTIEQYAAQCFVMRKNTETDLINVNAKELVHDIRIMQDEVDNRMKFSLPVYYINSYNVDSCIISLNGNKDYYHIIDIAMFGYFHEFLSTLEFDMPNYAVFVYRRLRRDICLSRYNNEEALHYDPKEIFANKHDIIDNGLPKRYTETKEEEFKCMIRFYFLHEYCHYFIKNPIRESSNEIVDMLVETFFENIEGDNNPKFPNKEIQQMAVNKLRNDWRSNHDLREEIYCDFQAIMCLLELPGISRRISADMIFNSVMSFIYIQHIMWQAKHIDKRIEILNQFNFRQNIIVFFAWLMEEDEYSDLVCKFLQKNNRFFIPTKLRVTPTLWEKQQNFYAWFTDILVADRVKDIKDGKYVFPVFIQPEYD